MCVCPIMRDLENSKFGGLDPNWAVAAEKEKNDDFLVIKPTDAMNSNFIGIATLHVSGSLSAHHQELLAVHRLWYTLCSCDRLLPSYSW